MSEPQNETGTSPGQPARSAPATANEERFPSYKLDLRYFTDPRLCPAMVRRRSRRAFELFLFLARRTQDAWGEPVAPTHQELCRACGLEPNAPGTRVTLSRLLRELRTTYGVIDYDPVRRRRPVIRLRPPGPEHHPQGPAHYVHLGTLWGPASLERFHQLSAKAFAAEYLYLLAAYEAALARSKQGRAYWFFPLERLTEMFHISPRFASTGLQGLVELGVLRVVYGQFGLSPRQDEFGRANRYYFEGLSAVRRREELLSRIADQHEQEFPLALQWSAVLTNGGTAKNVAGLCRQIQQHGPTRVQAVVEQLQRLPRRSLKRRLAYLAAVLGGSDRE